MTYTGRILVVLLVAAVVHLCSAESSTSSSSSLEDSTTQPYLADDASTVTSVVAIASPSSEADADSVARHSTTTLANEPLENTTESSSATTGIRRVRQVLSSDAMTRMRPPPPPRGGVSPYPFWNQTPPPQSRGALRGPQTFPQRVAAPATRILRPQGFTVETGFNPATRFTANPFPTFAVFNAAAFDPGRQRAQVDFQGQFGSIGQDIQQQLLQQQQTNAVQAVIGFPTGQRVHTIQNLNDVVQVVQGPNNNNNNGQPVTFNTVHSLLSNNVLPPRNNRQPLLNNNGRPQDLQQSASNHAGAQAQSVLNEVQDFATLLNTAPHLQAAFGGGNNVAPAGAPNATSKPTEARKKATLKEILAEDCPLASAMGYCPSPPRYPAHQVGVITRQCEQIMASLYAPLPAQDTVVSTTLRSAILSSSNASDMERGNRQIWSWARYSQDKSELDTEHNMMCSSARREMEPGYARDMVSGRWFVVIQSNNRYSQRVTVDKCSGEGEPCSGLKGAHCTGFRTRFKQSECVQRYSYVSLITWDPDQPQQCPKMRLFKFPTACVCQLN